VEVRARADVDEAGHGRIAPARPVPPRLSSVRLDPERGPDRARLSLRQQAQPFAVPRPHGSEVPVIERRDFRLSQALADCDDGGVDHAEPQLRVRRLELCDAEQIVGVQILESVSARRDVFDEDGPHARLETFPDPVVDLYQRRRRDDEGLVRSLNELGAPTMIRILGIQGGEDGARIQN